MKRQGPCGQELILLRSHSLISQFKLSLRQSPLEFREDNFEFSQVHHSCCDSPYLKLTYGFCTLDKNSQSIRCFQGSHLESRLQSLKRFHMSSIKEHFLKYSHLLQLLRGEHPLI